MGNINALSFNIGEESVQELLRGAFPADVPFAVNDALSALRKGGVSLPALNSPKEEFMFFEQFSSFLRVRHESGTLSLFDPDEAKGFYDEAVDIMRDMGYGTESGAHQSSEYPGS